MLQQRNLILVTSWFPFGKGETFLETEIRYLADRFDQVIVIPLQIDENRRDVPQNVRVEHNYATTRPYPTKQILLRAVLQNASVALDEAIRHLPSLVRRHHLTRALYVLKEAQYLSKWLSEYLVEHELNSNNTVLYSYWLNAGALGLGLLKKRLPQWRSLARGLGSDVYEEVFSPPYIPFRRATLHPLDVFAAASNHMRSYVLERYLSDETSYEVHRLSVADPGFTNEPSSDSTFRIVSCSFLVPLKRISLLIAGLALAARRASENKFEWHHLGDGPLRKQLEHEASEALPSNVRWHFAGQLQNRDVMAFYRTHPVDLFVNTSSSEGIPVAAMEAQSCGIPVLATAVGGVPELVSEGVGYLLTSDPSPEQIAEQLLEFARRQDNLGIVRAQSQENWRTRYNAEDNFARLADRLLELLDRPTDHA